MTTRRVVARTDSNFLSPMATSSRRSLYRIVYPLTERPVLAVGRFIYEVIDCSERGLRYEVKGRRAPSLGTPLGGILRLRRGGAGIQVTGEVIRIRGTTVALALDSPGIPFANILAEQRYLRSRGFTLRD
jgi:hypothetical protein